MRKNVIKIKIKCSSKECNELREEGLFFASIAEALGVGREDIEEIEHKN